MLSVAAIANACGKHDYDDVEELEIIFDEATEIGNLDCMYRLRSLRLIMNNLQRISGLNSVASTLQHLCLCEQEISIMENLALPHLQELLLHRNKIVAISGLEGCPRLRKLWLFSNRITRIEGLHHCGFLTELWLQDNQIADLTGLDSLVSLRQLELAGNQISTISQLQILSSLPALSEVSFRDIHFGDCIVAEQAGYREAVACYLPQVTLLDGVEITHDDAAAAFAARNEHIAMFNQAVNELELEFHRKVLELNNKRAASETHTATFEKEMQTAMEELESLVADGRESMQRELKRYGDICKSSYRHFSNRVDRMTEEAETQLRQLGEQAQEKFTHAELVFAMLEAVTVAEENLIDALEAVNLAPQPVYTCRPLDEQTPDYHMLLQDTRMPTTFLQQHFDAVDIVRAYRIIRSQPLSTTRAPGSSGRLPNAKTLYALLPAQIFQTALVHGLGKLREHLLLHDSLEMALALDAPYYGARASLSRTIAENGDSGEGKEQQQQQQQLQIVESPVDVYVAVACTTFGVAHEESVTISLEDLENDPLGLRNLLTKQSHPTAIHVKVESISSPPSASAKAQHSPRNRGFICVAVPPGELADTGVLFEHCLLCTRSVPGVDASKLDDILDMLSQPQFPTFDEVAVVQTFQASLQEEVRHYREHVLEQIEPATADRLRESERAIVGREDSVHRLRSQIDSERQAQEAMVREVRSTMSVRHQQSQAAVQSRTQQAYLTSKPRPKQRLPRSMPKSQHRQRPGSAGPR